MQTVTINLPVFTGFYESLYDNIIDNLVEDTLSYTGVDFDNIDFDYKKAYIEIAKEITEKTSEINFFDLDFKFLELDSPKFYNYRNDKIKVSISIDSEKINEIKGFVLENKDSFSEYIEDNFSTRPGFISFVGSDFNQWINNYSQIDNEYFYTFIETALNVYALENFILEEDIYNKVFESCICNGRLEIDYTINN